MIFNYDLTAQELKQHLSCY